MKLKRSQKITSICETQGLRGLTRGMFKFLLTQCCSGKEPAEARHQTHNKHISVSSISKVIFLFVLVWYQVLVHAWWIFPPILSFHLKLEAALHLIPITLSHFKPLFICRMLGPAVAANLHQIVTFTMLANSLFPFLLCSRCHRLLAITLFLENCNSPKRLSCLASWTTLQTTKASNSTKSCSLRKSTCVLTLHCSFQPTLERSTSSDILHCHHDLLDRRTRVELTLFPNSPLPTSINCVSPFLQTLPDHQSNWYFLPAQFLDSIPSSYIR